MRYLTKRPGKIFMKTYLNLQKVDRKKAAYSSGGLAIAVTKSSKSSKALFMK